MNEAVACDLLRSTVEKVRPRAVFALFSGGDDSLASTEVAMQTGLVDQVVHIDTGVGLPETQEFVKATCSRQGWPLRIIRSGELRNNWTYQDMVLRYGFPGKAGHNLMYQRLKERGLRQVCREARKKRGDKFILVSGGRSQESNRRMGYVEPVQFREWVWVAPLHDWSKLDCLRCAGCHNLERNPVSSLIHKSGECLCGAFAGAFPGRGDVNGKRTEEFEELYTFFKTFVEEQIFPLEDKAQKAGFPWRWDDYPPKWYMEKKRGQGFLVQMESPMCVGCGKRAEEAETA